MDFSAPRKLLLLTLWLLLGAGVVYSSSHPSPYPPEAPHQPPQESTTGLGLAPFSSFLEGTLPQLPHQRPATRCDPDNSQEAIDGGCWVRTTRAPPCPPFKQWEYRGACYLPVLERPAQPNVSAPR